MWRRKKYRLVIVSCKEVIRAVYEEGMTLSLNNKGEEDDFINLTIEKDEINIVLNPQRYYEWKKNKEDELGNG